MTVLLEAQNISIQRQERFIIRRYSCTLNAGDIIHLCGENGAGKSTLLQALAGLNPPLAGTIISHHKRLYLGHGAGIYSALTPYENLYFYARLHHDLPEEGLKERLQAALEAVGLSKQAHRPCRYLSAGQQRRSQLARLYLSTEKIWLLDEPFNALDAASVAALEALFVQQQARGGAVLFSSHQKNAWSFQHQVWQL